MIDHRRSDISPIGRHLMSGDCKGFLLYQTRHSLYINYIYHWTLQST